MPLFIFIMFDIAISSKTLKYSSVVFVSPDNFVLPLNRAFILHLFHLQPSTTILGPFCGCGQV